MRLKLLENIIRSTVSQYVVKLTKFGGAEREQWHVQYLRCPAKSRRAIELLERRISRERIGVNGES